MRCAFMSRFYVALFHRSTQLPAAAPAFFY